MMKVKDIIQELLKDNNETIKEEEEELDTTGPFPRSFLENALKASEIIFKRFERQKESESN